MSSCSQSFQARLRILETTDLHMYLQGYDYFADQATDHLGLANLAGLIGQMQAQETSLLFDNGDFLQGNPLADTLAQDPDQGQPHPMIAAMNDLGYDAITLGNHEFDYGLPYLRRVLTDAAPAVVSANLHVTDGPPLAQDYTVLTRRLACSDGHTRKIRIGVTGFAPPYHPQGHADEAAEFSIKDIVNSAEQIIPKIRDAGADVVIVLAHTGLGAATHSPGMENAAIPLAAVDGADVLLLGHTHGQFPDPDLPATPLMDPIKGCLHGKPVVMAGYYGRSLGVIDLDLDWAADGWRILGHSTRLLAPEGAFPQTTPQQQRIVAQTQDAHARTRTSLHQQIARTHVPIHSFFATVKPDLSLQILAEAMQARVTAELAQQGRRAWPVLAAVSPFCFGGPYGLGQFIDIPPGPITLRDAAAIFPFADRLCAVRRTGAQIKLWLERAASHYNRIAADTCLQELLNPHSPAYNCDALYGLTYGIDLAQPARFDPHGSICDAAASRITDLRYNDRPVADDDVFVVAMNSFRASGSGGFAQIPQADVLWRSEAGLRDILIAALQAAMTIDVSVTPLWHFLPIPNAQAQFYSHALAQAYLPANIHQSTPQENNLARYTLTF